MNYVNKFDIFMFIIWTFVLVGWIENISKLLHIELIDTEFILRIVGIFAFPLGGLLGWISL